LEKVEKGGGQMEHYMIKNSENLLILVTLIVVAVLAAIWATLTYRPPRSFPGEEIGGYLESYYIIKTVVSTINVTLLGVLLITYIDIYLKTRSEFTIGLIIFSIVFLLNTLASNPLVHWAFGFRAFDLGPFIVLPDLFTCAALIVLFYLSIKY
jgi:hypothetical protein